MTAWPDMHVLCFLRQLCTPANTPATPPNFPDALAMFSRLCTSDAGGSYAVSPVGPVPMSPHGSCASFWPPSPPEGSMHWVNPTSTWPPTSQQPSTHQTPPVALAADGKR
uniref:Uncharacterized protein n=1 Tax=Eptatretus burgeri TaxID=7764 RepID=A0A8C4RAQ9_EPTBU